MRACPCFCPAQSQPVGKAQEQRTVGAAGGKYVKCEQLGSASERTYHPSVVWYDGRSSSSSLQRCTRIILFAGAVAHWQDCR